MIIGALYSLLVGLAMLGLLVSGVAVYDAVRERVAWWLAALVFAVACVMTVGCIGVIAEAFDHSMSVNKGRG